MALTVALDWLTVASQELAMVPAGLPNENPAVQPAARHEGFATPALPSGGNDSNTTEPAAWRE